VTIEALQARIEELEVRVAFQEDALQTLNTQLAHQQQTCEQLQQQLQLLYRQWRDMQEMVADGAVASSQEKPPHY
jgi:SlyX protein